MPGNSNAIYSIKIRENSATKSPSFLNYKNMLNNTNDSYRLAGNNVKEKELEILMRGQDIGPYTRLKIAAG